MKKVSALLATFVLFVSCDKTTDTQSENTTDSGYVSIQRINQMAISFAHDPLVGMYHNYINKLVFSNVLEGSWHYPDTIAVLSTEKRGDSTSCYDARFGFLPDFIAYDSHTRKISDTCYSFNLGRGINETIFCELFNYCNKTGALRVLSDDTTHVIVYCSPGSDPKRLCDSVNAYFVLADTIVLYSIKSRLVE